MRKTVSRCFAILRHLRQICRSLPTFVSLVVTLVNSRLDYGNGALTGQSLLTRRLQSVLNAAAWLIFNLRRSDHFSDSTISLHWLCVPTRIRSTFSVLVYKVLHVCALLTCSPMLPTFQDPEGFALPVATASFNLRFTAPLIASDHFRFLVFRCGTACHRRLRRHRLWKHSALD